MRNGAIILVPNGSATPPDQTMVLNPGSRLVLAFIYFGLNSGLASFLARELALWIDILSGTALLLG